MSLCRNYSACHLGLFSLVSDFPALIQACGSLSSWHGASVRELITLEACWVLLLRRTAVTTRSDATCILASVPLFLCADDIVFEVITVSSAVSTCVEYVSALLRHLCTFKYTRRSINYRSTGSCTRWEILCSRTPRYSHGAEVLPLSSLLQARLKLRSRR
jgi:hypothetical protein